MAKTKRKTLDEQFDDVYQDAVSAAERVECSLEAFAEGCRHIAQQFRERAQMADEEAQGQGGSDDD